MYLIGCCNYTDEDTAVLLVVWSPDEEVAVHNRLLPFFNEKDLELITICCITFQIYFNSEVLRELLCFSA